MAVTSAFFVSYGLFAGWVTNALLENEVEVIVGVIAAAGFLLSSILVLFIQQSLLNTMVARMRLSIQKDLAENLLRQKESVSGVLNMYNQEIDTVLNGYIRNIPLMFNLLFSFALATIYALFLSWQITVGLVAVSIVSVSVNHLYKGKLSSAMEDFREKNQLINSDVKGYFSNIKMINFFGANNFVLKKFKDTLDKSNKSSELSLDIVHFT
ncbi:MAG: ABC transporter transmembrane domain-containing protein [Defluviitaleaceae bacterium]|nr:ABC transporter transmembrane domain-containing protein [Defluviitaleaceae bacterium]